MQRKIRRDYRRMTRSAAQFLTFCQKVKQGLTDNANYPDSIWGGHVTLRQQYFDKVDVLFDAHHAALDMARSLIRQRDKVIQELVEMLDQIASFLEAVSVQNPDALFTTGFDVVPERRSTKRIRLPLLPALDFNVTNLGEQGKAIGNANNVPGAYNHEIHINTKDPSNEKDWVHKAMFPDSKKMVLEGLEPGNTFFRHRSHGPDGPGPWSPIITTQIT